MQEVARCGNTRIVSYNGQVIQDLKLKQGIVSAELDLELLRKFRQQFPVLKQINRFK